MYLLTCALLTFYEPAAIWESATASPASRQTTSHLLINKNNSPKSVQPDVELPARVLLVGVVNFNWLLL